MSLFERVNERREITWDRIYGSDTHPVSTNSGTSVSEETALKYSVVWAAVGLITDAVSFLTPEAYREDLTGQIIQEAVPSWVLRPHPEIRRSQVWGQVLMGSLLWGNGYGLMVRRDSDGMPVGMLPVAPNDMECEWDLDKPGYLHYRLNNPQQYGQQYGPWLSSGDVFHIPGMTLPGQAKGLSVIAQARESIGLGLTLEEFGARYFSQGSMAKVVLQTPKTLTEQQARDMVNIYEKFHKGKGNWHRPAVLSGGGEIKNISIPPNDAQFLQSREFQAVDVARWFRVPPHRVGIISKQTSWGSGLAEENMALVQSTYRPWIRRLEDGFTAYSPGGEDRGVRIKLNDSELLRGSFKEQVDAWGIAVEKQLATPNEGRKALGLSPIAGGDKLAKPAAPAAPKPAAPGKPVDEEQKSFESPPFVLTPGVARIHST